MRRALLPPIAAALALGIAGQAQAVVLVTPQGQPVGGQWQRWVNEMRVPTLAGRLVFVDGPDVCGPSPGCSAGWPPGHSDSNGTGTGRSNAEIWIEPGPNARYALYYELGHQFDWAYLTKKDRRYLAHHWGHGDARWYWWDRHAGEDGLEGMFPAIYADCASGLNDKDAGVGVWAPFPGAIVPPNAYPTINTCVYLDQVAKRVHADTESSRRAPWNHASLP